MNSIASLVLLASCALLIPAWQGDQEVVTRTDHTIVDVRAYADGNMHVGFDRDLTSRCAGRLRIPQDVGADRLLRVALAGLMSRQRVDVQFEDSRSGNFCNILSLQLHDG